MISKRFIINNPGTPMHGRQFEIPEDALLYLGYRLNDDDTWQESHVEDPEPEQSYTLEQAMKEEGVQELVDMTGNSAPQRILN